MGKNKLNSYSTSFKKVIIVTGRDYTDTQKSQFEKLKIRYPNLELQYPFKYCKALQDNIHKDDNNKHTSPQSGFIAYFMLIEKYPDANINLVGFSRRNNTNRGHSYKHEYEYYKKKWCVNVLNIRGVGNLNP